MTNSEIRDMTLCKILEMDIRTCPEEMKSEAATMLLVELTAAIEAKGDWNYYFNNYHCQSLNSLETTRRVKNG